MAWKCPNCETLNQGKKCIVCNCTMPRSAKKKGKGQKRRQNIKPLIIVVVCAIAVVALVLALALSQSDETVNPNIDTTTAQNDVTTSPDVTLDSDTEPDVTTSEVEDTTAISHDTTAESERVESETSDGEVGIKSVSLDITELTIKSGESVKLNGSIRHVGNVDLSVKWASSDTDIVNVTANGIVIGVKAGSAVVTMTASNGMSAECRVTVEPSEVLYITLSAASVNLEVGSGKTINVNVSPADAINGDVEWEISDENIVMLTDASDTSVVVVAQSAGEATLTAKTSNGKSASCKITVTEAAVKAESIEIDEKTVNLREGDEHKLNVTVLPANATDVKLTYTSSDEEVAVVDENGNITAKKMGSAVITVSTENSIKASCTVNVKAEKVEALVLSESQVTMKVGDVYTITGQTIPEGFTILWTVSDDSIISTIGGRIYAISPGVATVYAYASDGVSATCTVTVESPVLPTSVSFESNRIRLDVGQTHTFKISLTPDDSVAALTFTSSNDEIATVDEKGVLTAHKEGVVAVNVKTSNGISAMCIVEIGNGGGASAESDFAYSYNVKGITITDYVGASDRVVIPEKIHGSPVTAIGAGAFIDKSVVYVKLPNSVDFIGEYAFANCHDLVSVDFGSSLYQIDAHAFLNCSNLADLSLPDSVSKIGVGAFENCSSLVSVKIPDQIREIASALFKGCTSLAEITVGMQVNSISNDSFDGCSENLVFISPEYSMASNFAKLNGFEVKNP
ncbi:MAG: Ig-like domain-containing protein [Clostridia bacterium]|nr:Ig-like domain-containing protein [Clostridia bacterium]